MKNLLDVAGYLALPISNLVMVVMLKDKYLSEALIVYGTSSGFISITALIIFSKYSINIKQIAVCLLVTQFIALSLSALGFNSYLFSIFVILLHFSLFDYWSTQFNVSYSSVPRILFLVLTIASFAFSEMLDILMITRFILFILCLRVFKGSFYSGKLKLRNATVYIFNTHIIYYGQLALLPFFSPIDYVRYLYVFSQLMHQLILRAFEYGMRASYQIDLRFLYKMIWVVGAMLLIAAFFSLSIDKNVAYSLVLIGVSVICYLPLLRLFSNDL